MSAGWLAADMSTDNTLPGGFLIDRKKFPTRYEEYKFVIDTLAALPVGCVMDGGAGFNPEIHVLPYALHELGWQVLAVDANSNAMQMEPRQHITRIWDDMTKLWRWRGTEMDAYVCVSTLEHLNFEQQCMAMDAAYDCLRSGGKVVLTADFCAPEFLLKCVRQAGFKTGMVEPFTGYHLVPRVAWATGEKP